MKRDLVRSEAFVVDVASQFAWYATEAGEPTAWRFVEALEVTIGEITRHPEQGRLRHFASPALEDMRSLRIAAPFDSLLLFYRLTPQSLELWRLLHGARDLPAHLAQPVKR